jgi:hypothetical protein
MNNYLYIVVIALIVSSWFLIAKYLMPYFRKRSILIVGRKERVLLISLMLFILAALVFTYVWTNGTFIWR